jgi:hypothetical protein
MRALFLGIVILHGLIHLLGLVKGVGPAKITAVAWLAAALLFLASAAMLVLRSPSWWMLAVPAVAISQIAIIGAWSDAKYGTIANAIVLVPIAFALVDLRESSLRSRYQRDARELFPRAPVPQLVTEQDLARVPPLVQHYIRHSGGIGQPRIHDLEVRFKGELRNGVGKPWMKIRAEQRERFGVSTARLFFVEGSMYGLPFDGYHRMIGATATMEVRALSLANMVAARGPEMDQGETVTLFNDMCILAPTTLLYADIDWETISATTIRATFRNAGQRITADLIFDKNGDLANFVSRDRYMSADGKTYENYPWSTPLSDYREFGRARIAAKGEAVWSMPEGHFVYARFEVIELRYNLAAQQVNEQPARLSDGAATPTPRPPRREPRGYRVLRGSAR